MVYPTPCYMFYNMIKKWMTITNFLKYISLYHFSEGPKIFKCEGDREMEGEYCYFDLFLTKVVFPYSGPNKANFFFLVGKEH